MQSRSKFSWGEAEMTCDEKEQWGQDVTEFSPWIIIK